MSNEYWEKQHDKIVPHPVERDTYDAGSVLRRNNMTRFFKDRKDAVRYAVGKLKLSKPGSRSTTIIEPVKSGGYYATFVTEELSDVMLTTNYSHALHST